jgi:hypothetical protein
VSIPMALCGQVMASVMQLGRQPGLGFTQLY